MRLQHFIRGYIRGQEFVIVAPIQLYLRHICVSESSMGEKSQNVTNKQKTPLEHSLFVRLVNIYIYIYKAVEIVKFNYLHSVTKTYTYIYHIIFYNIFIISF